MTSNEQSLKQIEVFDSRDGIRAQVVPSSRLGGAPIVVIEADLVGGSEPVETVLTVREAVAFHQWLGRALGHSPAETTAESVSLDYQLPCDVRLPPAATIGKGCTLRTLMHALRYREKEPVEFVDERAMAVRRALTELHRPVENVRTISTDTEHCTVVVESSEKSEGEPT